MGTTTLKTGTIILKDDELEMILRSAFFLGFAVTREGYNAECPYGHLAPDELFEKDYRIELLNNLWHTLGVEADWHSMSYGRAYEKLAAEAIAAIHQKFGKEKILPWAPPETGPATQGDSRKASREATQKRAKPEAVRGIFSFSEAMAAVDDAGVKWQYSHQQLMPSHKRHPGTGNVELERGLFYYFVDFDGHEVASWCIPTKTVDFFAEPRKVDRESFPDGRRIYRDNKNAK